MRKLFKNAKKVKNGIEEGIKETAQRVLRVTVLLSLGLESTTREYVIKFNEMDEVDEEKEGNKIVAYAKTKYTSIIHNGGNAALLQTKMESC
jgi:hypothetical protein